MPRRLSPFVIHNPGNLGYTLQAHGFQPYVAGRAIIVPLRIAEPDTDVIAERQLNQDGRGPPNRREIYVYRVCDRCNRFYENVPADRIVICGPLNVQNFQFVNGDCSPIVPSCEHIAWPYCICSTS